MIHDELLAAEKVRDLEREARALVLRSRLQSTTRRTQPEPRNRPPVNPPIPVGLAKEHRQAL